MSASLRLQTRKSGEEPDFRIRRALVPWHRACAHAAPRCGASNRSKIERSPARDSGRGHPLRPERGTARDGASRSEEHTSELQSLMRISYAVFCLKKKIITKIHNQTSSGHNSHYNTMHTRNQT